MKITLVIIFLSIVFSISVTCQPGKDSTAVAEDIKPTIPLTLKMLNNYPDYLIINSQSDFSLPEFYMLQSNEMQSTLSLNLKNINKQLLFDFKQQMSWKKEQDLGVFGQYLGYAMSAAVAGLAISHIVKYKDKAFFGR